MVQLITIGRRERKKAATRQALSEAAMKLFVERGFDAVTVREIADAADVSSTTLMKHFPTKEALVFDRDDEIERALVATVVAGGSSKSAVLAALRRYMRARAARVVSERRTAFMKLVRATPALGDYWQKMWMRHEAVLALALAKQLRKPHDDLWCTAVAHYVLGAAALAEDSRQPTQMIEIAFDVLQRGATAESRARRRAGRPSPASGTSSWSPKR